MLHRGVTDTVVHNTTASHNGVDGVSVTRAATGVVLDRLTAEQNGRNGITLEGGPLADGPSATGTPTGSYGNNQVTNSIASGNGRYGIEVVGGKNLVLDGNSVSGQTMGIVVARQVDGITISDNIVEESSEHAIALRDGVTNATVQGNSIKGGEVGIYLRDASGLIDRNTVSDVGNHAVTVIDAPGDDDGDQQHGLRARTERDRRVPGATRSSSSRTTTSTTGRARSRSTSSSTASSSRSPCSGSRSD